MSIQPTNLSLASGGGNSEAVAQHLSLTMQSAAASQQELTRMVESFQKAMQDMQVLIETQNREIATLKASLLQMQNSTAESLRMQTSTNLTVSQSITAIQTALRSVQTTQTAQATQLTQTTQGVATCNQKLAGLDTRITTIGRYSGELQRVYNGHTHNFGGSRTATPN